jgi:hypothetical protein
VLPPDSVTTTINNNNNNQQLSSNKPDIIIRDNGKETFMLMDGAISGEIPRKCD